MGVVSRRPATVPSTQELQELQDEASQRASQPFVLEFHLWKSGTGQKGLPFKVHSERAARKRRFRGGVLCCASQWRTRGGCEGGEQGREGDAGVRQHSLGGGPHAASARCARGDQAVGLL